MNDDDDSHWVQARALFAQGLTTRQIAHRLDLPIITVTKRAKNEDWPEPPPPDWQAIRNVWEGGQSVRMLAKQFKISENRIRKRQIKEEWQRGLARGVEALRLSVRTLEETMKQTDPGDATAIARLAAALSMAASRLRDAEKQITEKAQAEVEKESGFGPEGEEEVLREQMMAMLLRLSEDEPPET
jgi:transposase